MVGERGHDITASISGNYIARRKLPKGGRLFSGTFSCKNQAHRPKCSPADQLERDGNSTILRTGNRILQVSVLLAKFH